MNIKVSDRVKEQQPLFIQEENEVFYKLLQEYYKSQEKTGRPYDIVNNLLNYFDVDQYNAISLTESTVLLDNVGYNDDVVYVESITGFKPVDGSFLIDKEVFYYESTTESPQVVLTPGVSIAEFNSRYQVLESILPQLVPVDGVMGNTYELRVAGIPVSPIDEDHLIVSLYGKILKPQIDYNIDNTNIVFTEAPRPKTSDDGEGDTYIKYLLGFAQNIIQPLDEITTVLNRKIYPVRLNLNEYQLKSEILTIVSLDGDLLEPYVDYVFTSNNEIELLSNTVVSGKKIYLRAIEYTAKEVGSGATAISRVVDGKLVSILVKNNGSGYSTSFVPKVTIDSKVGGSAAAVTLIDGIKKINLLYGGTGYTSQNPPLITFTEPPEGGTLPIANAVIDDATGTVSAIELTNSGSGYTTPPKVKFINPSGAKITPKALIDEQGKIIPGSIQILESGYGYTTPPRIYIDPPTAEGSNAAILEAVLTDGQVSGFNVLSRGNGYTFEPRVRIIEPVGAQILDVTVSNGSVINIEILSGGTGYIDPPSVYIVDDRRDINGVPYGGTGAQATATIFNGAITDINITSFGTGYSADQPPTVYISPPPEARASASIGVGEVTGFKVIAQGSGYTPSSFVGVSRGVSNVVGYDSNGEQIFRDESISRSRQHALGSDVINIDSYYLLQMFDRFVDQYLPDFNIDYTKVNASQVVKSIKEFYLSKGTKNALEYLFKVLYGENIDITYPKEELFKPSAASWSVDTILRAVLVSGDPGNLVNSVLYQYEDDVDTNIKFASALVENVISIYVGNTQIYEISISEETKVGSFVIPYRTKLVEAATTTSNIITVDSTLGWPERNGTVILGKLDENPEYIQYKEKTLNQFLECTRAKNGVSEDWDAGTEISSDILLYANYGTDQEVVIKVVGIAEATGTILSDSGSYYLPGDKLTVAKLGATTENEKVTSWLYNVKKLVTIENIVPGGINNKTATVTCVNPHGLLVGDQVTIYGANPIVYNGSFAVASRISDTVFSYELPQPAELSPQGNILISVDLNKGKSDDFQINNLISKYTTNIQNTFFNNDYVYVASTGIPNYKIGPFLKSALIPGNQRKLNRFPLKPNTTSVRYNIKSGPIATFVNGISAWSYKSPSYITYGGVTGVDILSAGDQYDAANPPILTFRGGGGSGASATVSVNGSISAFEVTSGGEGYEETPLVSIVGGGGSGATARAIVTNGVVTQILVENAGEGYTSEPIISISGGGGFGATALAQVRGPISKVNLISSGSDYTSVPVAVLSSGEKAEAQAIIINGRVVSIAVINAGQGYTTAPNVYINGDGFGAKAKAIIGTIGEDKGKVIGIQIINRGIGYTQGQTTIRLEAIGQGAVFKTNVFSWQYDLNEELKDNFDAAKGYVFAGYNTQYGGEYGHISNPQTLRYVLGDNVFKNTNQIIQENEGTFRHSPIIGWAFDGNPIYGPYGYTDATDSSKGVRRMRSSYKLLTNIVYNADTNPEPVRIDGPPLSQYPAGTFVQDYEYTFNYGDLDEYNGRFCKTPEFPTGTYAYFVTIDASANGNPVFPYIIGPQYYSAVDAWNLSQNAVQINIPTNVVRYRDPFEDVDIDTDRQPNARTDYITTEAGETIIFEIQDSNNDGLISITEESEILELTEEQALEIFDYFPKVDIESKVDIEVETTTKFESAQIDGFVIENPGVNYKVNDKVTFDNEGTDGFGASAKVESIVGSKILNYSTTFDGENTIATITTEDDHGLVIGDTVIVETEPALDTNFKNFKVKTVAGLEEVVVIEEGIGYNVDIPPVYELITDQGQDAVIDLVLNQGKISNVNIINSGNGYSVQNPPQIRVTPPQIFKKANYFATEFEVADGVVEWFDSYVAKDRSIYLCGRMNLVDDKIAVLAKFNNDGRLVWKRTITPTQPAAGDKDAVWKKLVVVETNPHTIYVVGETVQNTVNLTYNPDVLVAKYVSGFNAQNQPDGIIQWQKELSGISGATRRDYASGIAWSDSLDALIIGGYTDTNTLSGNDMWFIIMNTLGDVVDKRKVTSDTESEVLTDLIAHGQYIYWTGIVGGEDIIYGRLSYDNVDILFDWGRRIPNPTNYKFVDAKIKIDDYESIYLYATETNNSTSEKEKITLFRFDLSNYEEVVWAKRLSPAATTFTSLQGIGLQIDIFNNITIGAAVETSTASFVDIVKFKHDGSILQDSRVLVNTSWEGKTIAVDNSADIFIAGSTVDTAAITKLDNNHTKLGVYTITTLNDIETVTNTDITYSVDEEYNPQITTFNVGSAGYQLLDFADAVSVHLPGNYVFTSNTETTTSRTATVPTPSGRPLRLQANVIKKFYIRDSLVTKADVIKKITFNQNARFEVGKQLQWYTIQGTGENTTEIVTAYGSIVETGDNYATIGKIYGNLNLTSRLKDTDSTVNELPYTFVDVPFAGTLGTFEIALSDYTSDIISAEFKDFNADDYVLKIVSTIPGSSFLPGDIVPIGYNGVTISFDSEYQIATITGLSAVDKITLVTNLRKIVKATDITNTDELFIVANSAHNYHVDDIIYVEGFLYSDFNGSFFINRVINNREYVYGLRSIPAVAPVTSTSISAVQVHAKHPSLVFVKGHQYIFDVGDSSNAGYYLSFSKDNQYKLEYSFNNITRNGNPGIDPPGVIPYVRFKTVGEVTNISYYFDPSHTGSDSPVGVNSFIDVVDTPYKGRFRITAVPTSKQFKFTLEREPEGPVILDSTYYSTTSLKANGPINTIKLVNKGGFYKKLPVITDIASERQIDRVVISNPGTEYAVGVYREVPILGDGEGGKVNITVELGGDPVSGIITKVDLIDPGKGYTTGYIDVEGISGILGPSLSGSGAQLDVIIPPQGTGASVFLQGTQIGKIKKLKNNNFGYNYPHDYTLKPEITFPTILQLFNTSVLTSIKITDPGAGYTSAPAVIISGGGGTGAQAVAIVRNNRLQEIVVKDPGSGYSSEPSIALKSEFTYVVNVDLGYFQFNFPHGITTGAEVTLRADSVGSTEGILPQPSSAGLTSLVEGQIYYAIAGNANGLEDNQLRIALTLQDAQNGQFITFLNNGEGKQILLTEVFGGKAQAIVETSRFLQGEKVYQGDLANPTAQGYVSNNNGWQIGPRLLKVVDYTGDWKVGEKVTGVISKASGTIDNINTAVGTLNIGSVTQTPGKFIDNVGKPSEIVQKIQDSYFYQDFSYVVNSEIPINQWRNTVRKVNHPAGFNLFGQLNLSGGKDLSGRRVSTDFTKRVDISEFTNFAEIVNFAAAQPIYSEYNNSEVIFRNKRLTSSEEILTSVVKKIDDISDMFDGERKSFPLKIQGEQVIASTGQSMILINGIVQAPLQSYSIANGNIEFTEAPKPPASVVYREIEFEQIQVKRISINNISGILPEINNQIRGITSNAVATVIKSTTSYIDVINVVGSFQINETIVSSQTGLNANVTGIEFVLQQGIFQFGEQITNLDKKIAVIEEINLATSLPKYPTQVSAFNNITAQTAHRFSDAANLIQGNRQFIIEQSFADMQTQFPLFTVPGGAGANDKCKRDLGYIVDAIIADIRGGGNSNIIEATKAYFYQGQPLDNGLAGEEEQSIYAFERAKYYMQQAVVNQLAFKDVDILVDNVSATNGNAGPNNTNLNPNNCSDVRSAINTLVNILTNALNTGSINALPVSNPGVWNIGSSTNKLVISKTYGTSKYETGLFELELYDYFISSSTGIVARITKINPYRDPSTNQVVGTLNISTGSTFFGLLFERLPLPQNPNTIVDDISKTIIGASTVDNYDLLSNQNFPLSEYAQNINLVYNNSTGTWTNGEYIRNTKISYVNSVPPEDHRGYDAKKLIQLNKSAIIDQVIEDIVTEYPDFDFPGNSTLKCERDLGYIIDAVCNDIVSNGNANIVIATKRYFDTNGSVVYLNGEEEQSIYAFVKARDYMKQAITNTLTIPGAQQDLTIIADSVTGSNTDPASCADIQSQITTLVSILTTCLTDGDLDSLSGVSITDGAFTEGEIIRSRKLVYKNKSKGTFFPDYKIKGVTSGATADIIGVNSANAYLYVKPPTGTFQSGEKIVNLDITNTGTPKVRLVSTPNFRYLDAADRIKENYQLIKEETIGYIARKYPDFYYPKSPSYSYRYKDAANLIRGNVDYIVTTAYSAMVAQYPTFTVPDVNKCKRDLKYIVLSIAQDLYDGGNQWTILSTKSYFDNNGDPISNGLVGETAQSVYAFNQAKGLCKQAITNQLPYKDLTIIADPNPGSGTASNTNSTSCTGVQNTIDTLFALLTTAINSGSINGLPSVNTGDFSPGEETCKRDLEYILDGFVFDMQYGGNSATVNNGDFYIDGNGNLLYLVGEESQSRSAFKYARDLCIAAMRNFTVTLPSTVRNGTTTLTVTSTVGIVEGMDVTGTGFNSGTVVVEVLSDTTVLLNQNPASSGTGDATFTLNYAKYSVLTPSKDLTLTVDASNPTCANVASTINTLWQTLDDIISTRIVPEATTPEYNNKFGTASAAFGVSNSGTNNIKINNPEKLELGTNDFTIEMWLYRTTIGTSQTLLDMKSTSSAEIVPTITINSLNNVVYSANGSTRITSNVTIGAETWTHLAIVRDGLTTKMYINGVAQSQTFNDTLNYVGNPLRIGSSYQDNNGYRGLIDEFRMSMTARYTADFVPATEASEGDSGDILLFHFDGENGTTNIYPESYVEATYDSLRTSVANIGQIDPLNKVLTVETIDGSRNEYKVAAEYVRKNRELIIDEMIGRLKAKYPSLVIPGDDAGGSEGTNLCARDSAYIVDAIISDLINGGNYNTVYTAKYYLEKSGALRFISGELLQSVYAYNQIGIIINQILTNTFTAQHSTIISVPVQTTASTNVTTAVSDLCTTIASILAPTGNRFFDAGNLLYYNRAYIAEEVADGIEAYFKWTYTATGIVYDVFTNPNRDKCIRDMKDYIIPAMISDLLTGGNNATIESFKYYIDSNTNFIYIEDELLAMHKALELAKPIAQRAVNNLLYSKNSVNTPTGAYIANYTNIAAYRDLTILPDGESNQNPNGCANVTSAISTLFDLMLDIIAEESAQYSSINRRNAAKLILFNRSYIANEAYNEVKAAYPLYPGDVQFGYDIINDILYDVITNGNGKAYARCLSWLDAFYNFIAFVGYNPVQIKYHLDRIKFWTNKAISQTLNALGPTTNQPRYSELALTVGNVTTFVDNEIELYNTIITTPSSITSQTRDPGIEIPTVTYGTRSIPVPYSISMEPSSFIYGETSTTYAEVSQIIYNKYQIRTTYSRFNINLDAEITYNFVEGETVSTTANDTAVVYQTDGSTYIDVISISGDFGIGETITGETSSAVATLVSKDTRMMLKAMMGEFANGEYIYSENTSAQAQIQSWNYNTGAILDNTGGKLTLDTETVVGAFSRSDLVYSSESEYIISCMDAQGFRSPQIGEYVKGSTVTQIQVNTAAITTSGGLNDTFTQGDKLDVIINNLPTGQYATIISYDDETGTMYVGNKTSQFDLFALGGSSTIGVYQLGTLQPKIFTQALTVNTTTSNPSGRITRIDQSGTAYKLWLTEVEGTFLPNQQITASQGFKLIALTVNDVVARTNRYSRGFDGSNQNFKLTYGGANYFPDPDGHLLVFVNGILQPPGADYAYTVFADNIQFTEAPAAGSTFHAYYVGKLRLLDDISFDFDSLRSSFNLKLAGSFYSLTITQGVQSSIILPENNIIVAVNGVLQEPGVGFKLVGSRITFSEIPRAGSSFIAFSYVGSDADVISATVVPPIEIGDEIFIDGEEYNRSVAVIESSNSLVTYEYSGSVKGRNGSAVAEIKQGRLNSALVTSPGSGYKSRPSVDVLSPTGFDGQLIARVGVYRVDIANGGSNYAYPSIAVDNVVPDLPTGFSPQLDSDQAKLDNTQVTWDQT